MIDEEAVKFQIDVKAFNSEGQEIWMLGVDFDENTREQAIYNLRTVIQQEHGINILPGSIY